MKFPLSHHNYILGNASELRISITWARGIATQQDLHFHCRWIGRHEPIYIGHRTLHTCISCFEVTYSKKIYKVPTGNDADYGGCSVNWCWNVEQCLEAI